MPQIADMIAELDSDKGRKEVVGFYDLQNADPRGCRQQPPGPVPTATRARMNNNNTEPECLGQNNPLYQRVQE